ncbi:hypothetical protein GCM10010178_90180 [Lentzea flava]|uniref:Secreted protein n=1 Tax=Lentzea flava TaxID=103732 RepID=A0ABQ2VJ95_9PSEU|nr:hypothetical protein [Lentzea flava]GGU86026.1 hypothetical protein GCM10010178_90180 [Lentzea flava]
MAMNPSTARISRRGLLIAAAGVVGTGGVPGLAHAAPSRGTQQGFHDVGSLAGRGTASEGADINDRSDIVGVTALPGTGVSHAFIMNPRFQGGQLFDLMPSAPRRQSRRTAEIELDRQIEQHEKDRQAHEASVLATVRAYRNIDERTAREIDETIDSFPHCWPFTINLPQMPTSRQAEMTRETDPKDQQSLGELRHIRAPLRGDRGPIAKCAARTHHREQAVCPPNSQLARCSHH